MLLAFQHSQRLLLAYPNVRLRGLEPNAMYRLHALDPEKYTGEAVMSGSVLMGAGVNVNLSGDYDSTALVIERVSR